MYDYALVHLTYTVPVAAVLTGIAWPSLTKLDVYKIGFLITVAVVYTIPWDSYLIRTSIWTYPPNVILGPTIFSIPVEEVFFFVIQTYMTTILHILLNKPVLLAAYLENDADPATQGAQQLQTRKRLGQTFFAFAFVVPLSALLSGEGRKDGTYMCLISIWASPVLLLLWSLSYQLLNKLPRAQIALPICLPTLYLWLVDTIALQRGTWSISGGTKLGIQLWNGLEIEEAIFFLITNMLVVFGSAAFDNAIAVLDVFPDTFSEASHEALPSPWLLIKALLTPASSYSTDRLDGIRNALVILARKSRSFYLASGVFSGRLRIDLILLYAFCRIADDLVDSAETPAEAEKWIKNLSHFLKVIYSRKSTPAQLEKALEPFSLESQSALRLLPHSHLSLPPLYSLLDGFRTDVAFLTPDSDRPPPIQTANDLEKYASRVASTVAELCLDLVYAHEPRSKTLSSTQISRDGCFTAGKRMGLALQYINIVRDVAMDAEQNRCYIPAEWFTDPPPTNGEGFRSELLKHRERILIIAMDLYQENRGAIEDLPVYARGGIRVAVESYMEIGREIQRRIAAGEALDSEPKGKATVPRWRRLWVGWYAMGGWNTTTRT